MSTMDGGLFTGPTPNAFLKKKKKPKGCLLAFLLLLLIIPGIIYLLMNKGKSTLMIEVTQKGDVTIATTGLSLFDIQELESY